MDIQQVNRTDPESVRVAFKNVDGGGSITTGWGIALVTTSASFDGVNSVKFIAAGVKSFWGVSQDDVPINSWGKAVVEGYAASVAISNVGSSVTVNAGDILLPGGLAGTFFSGMGDAALSTLHYRYVVSGQNGALSAVGYVQGLVKAF